MAANYCFQEISALACGSVLGSKGSVTAFAAPRSAATNIYLLIESSEYWPLVALVDIHSLGWL